MKVYRVKNLDTGLFSLGGLHPRWGKKGKLWTGEGPIKSHFRLIETEWWSFDKKEYYWNKVKDVYKNCVVIEANFETGEVKEIVLEDFWQPKHNKENVNGRI